MCVHVCTYAQHIHEALGCDIIWQTLQRIMWCLIPHRGLAVCLIWRQIDWVKICYVCNDHSDICEGMPMILSNNPWPQSFLPSGLHGYGAQQSDWMASPPHPTLPHPVSNSAPCQTERLPLGWVIVQKGGGNTGPREVKDRAGKSGWSRLKETGCGFLYNCRLIYCDISCLTSLYGCACRTVRL